MIELKDNELRFTFPEVYGKGSFTIDLQRTLRIPDDDSDYSLPPGLGNFPMVHVDDHAANVPAQWLEHGGVMFPMYQSEAMWLNFDSDYCYERGTEYPFAVKIAAGKINAVSGEDWTDGLNSNPQDYIVVPEQPWLDGFCVEKGIIRQFVAMPLGSGYSAEEQITGKAENGGLQVIVYPMKKKVFERRFPKVNRREICPEDRDMDLQCCMSDMVCESGGMGLGAGGRMRQEIYDDPFSINDWDLENSSRCFIHIANSMMWQQFTGDVPPQPPPTAKDYTDHGLPWFDYYSDAPALEGSKILNGVKSVATLGKQKGEMPLPENASVTPGNVVKLRKGMTKDQVREGCF